MFWIQAGCPHLNPEFLAALQPVYDLDHLILEAFPLLTEQVVFLIDYQLYGLAYQDFSSWVQTLVPFLEAVRQGQSGSTLICDQTGFDSEWTARPEGEQLDLHIQWIGGPEEKSIDVQVNREHFIREWKEPLLRVRHSLAPFVHLMENREDWEALVRLTDEIEGQGMLYGGIPEWELPTV
jgi:hypothetical protein